MARLDRSTMDHLGSALRLAYDPLAASSATHKQRDLLFRYALAETAREAEQKSREARLRLRARASDLLSTMWSNEVLA